MGGLIGDGAVVDPAFNTVDVCLVLPTERLKDRYLRTSRHAAVRPCGRCLKRHSRRLCRRLRRCGRRRRGRPFGAGWPFSSSRSPSCRSSRRRGPGAAGAAGSAGSGAGSASVSSASRSAIAASRCRPAPRSLSPTTSPISTSCSWAPGPMPPSSPRPRSGWPLFGAIGRAAGTFFIRRRWRDALVQRNTLAARLRAGESFILFAEGTSTDGLDVLPFKTSLLSVAEPWVLDRPIAVQPVTLAYRRLRCGSRSRRPIAAAMPGAATTRSCRISGRCCKMTAV
jgi:hypothetical protein